MIHKGTRINSTIIIIIIKPHVCVLGLAWLGLEAAKGGLVMLYGLLVVVCVGMC